MKESLEVAWLSEIRSEAKIKLKSHLSLLMDGSVHVHQWHVHTTILAR